MTVGTSLPLSPRQLEALRIVAEYPEETHAQQARRLGISLKTMTAHLAAARRKLGTATTLAALLEAGLLVEVAEVQATVP